MIIVSDTTPINYLVLIGEIDLLEKLYGRVIVPQAVVHELHHPRTPLVVSNWIAAPPAWIEIKAATAIDATLNLGAGEAEAISLAIELGADQLLIDERKARKIAVARGFQVTGTLNILGFGAAQELIDLPTVLTKLLQTTFRAPAELVQLLLDEDNVRKLAKQSGS